LSKDKIVYTLEDNYKLILIRDNIEGDGVFYITGIDSTIRLRQLPKTDLHTLIKSITDDLPAWIHAVYIDRMLMWWKYDQIKPITI
jgi:hypothetical protein